MYLYSHAHTLCFTSYDFSLLHAEILFTAERVEQMREAIPVILGEFYKGADVVFGGDFNWIPVKLGLLGNHALKQPLRVYRAPAQARLES